MGKKEKFLMDSIISKYEEYRKAQLESFLKIVKSMTDDQLDYLVDNSEETAEQWSRSPEGISVISVLMSEAANRKSKKQIKNG